MMKRGKKRQSKMDKVFGDGDLWFVSFWLLAYILWNWLEKKKHTKEKGKVSVALRLVPSSDREVMLVGESKLVWTKC